MTELEMRVVSEGSPGEWRPIESTREWLDAARPGVTVELRTFYLDDFDPEDF